MTTTPLFPSGQQVEITHGHHRATIVEVGGGIRSLTVGGEPVLDGYGPDQMCSSARGQALVPWPNRLADGQYDIDGEHLQVPLTEPEKHNAIHGLVRFANWAVGEQGPGRVVMTYRLHPQPGYPFVLDVSLDYTLGDDGLAVECRATNRGDRPCPVGAGAHPYLRLGTGGVSPLVLRSPGATFYTSDARQIPTGRRSVEGTPNDFRDARPIGSTVLDTGFTDLDRGKDGRAVVELAEPEGARRLRLWLDESYPYLMLYTGDTLPDPERRRQSLGIEPMTCAPNAFRSGDGLRVLAPGETMAATWGITTVGFPS